MKNRELIALLQQQDPELEVMVLEDNQKGDCAADITSVQTWDGMAVIEINAEITPLE